MYVPVKPVRFQKPIFSVYNFIAVRNYIGKGLNDSGFMKYFILMFGLADVNKSSSLTNTTLLGIGYIFGCFLWGLFWDIKGWNNVEDYWANMRKDWVSWNAGNHGRN